MIGATDLQCQRAQFPNAFDNDEGMNSAVMTCESRERFDRFRTLLWSKLCVHALRSTRDDRWELDESRTFLGLREPPCLPEVLDV